MDGDPGAKRRRLSITWVRQIFSLRLFGAESVRISPCDCNGTKRGGRGKMRGGDHGGESEEGRIYGTRRRREVRRREKRGGGSGGLEVPERLVRRSRSAQA